MQMANYLLPPPFSSDSKHPQIFWKTIETVHQKQTPEKSNKSTRRKKIKYLQTCTKS